MFKRNFAFHIRAISIISISKIITDSRGTNRKLYCDYTPKLSKNYSEMSKLLANQLFEKMKSQEKNDISTTINLIMKQYEQYYDFRYLIENKDYLFEKLIHIELAENEQKQNNLLNLVKFLFIINSFKCYETLLNCNSLFEKNGELDSKHLKILFEFVYANTSDIKIDEFFKSSLLLLQGKLRNSASDYKEVKYLDDSFKYICSIKEGLIYASKRKDQDDKEEIQKEIESYFPVELQNKIKIEIMKKYRYCLNRDLDLLTFYRLFYDDVRAKGNVEICNYEFWKNYFAFIEKNLEHIDEKELGDLFYNYCNKSPKIYKLENSLREKIKQRIKKQLDQDDEYAKSTLLLRFLTLFHNHYYAEKYLTWNILIIDKEKDPNNFYENIEFLGKFYNKFDNYSHTSLINNLLEYMDQLQFWAKSDLDPNLYKKDDPENEKFKKLFEKICSYNCNAYFKDLKSLPLGIKQDPFMLNIEAMETEYSWHRARMFYFLKFDEYLIFLQKAIKYLNFDEKYEQKRIKDFTGNFDFSKKPNIEVALILAYYSDSYKKRHERGIKSKHFEGEKILVKEIDENWDEFNLSFKYAKFVSYLEDWVVNDLNNFDLVSNDLGYFWEYIRRCLNAQLNMINENNLFIYINLLYLLKKKNIESDLIIKRIEELVAKEFANKKKMSLKQINEITEFYEAFGSKDETFAVEFEKFIKENNSNKLI